MILSHDPALLIARLIGPVCDRVYTKKRKVIYVSCCTDREQSLAGAAGTPDAQPTKGYLYLYIHTVYKYPFIGQQRDIYTYIHTVCIYRYRYPFVAR